MSSFNINFQSLGSKHGDVKVTVLFDPPVSDTIETDLEEETMPFIFGNFVVNHALNDSLRTYFKDEDYKTQKNSAGNVVGGTITLRGMTAEERKDIQDQYNAYRLESAISQILEDIGQALGISKEEETCARKTSKGEGE